MSGVQTTTRTTITAKHRMEVSGTALLSLINQLRIMNCETPIPENADVTVYVPGGGDWSHTDLEVCEDSPIAITWETREEH